MFLESQKEDGRSRKAKVEIDFTSEARPSEKRPGDVPTDARSHLGARLDLRGGFGMVCSQSTSSPRLVAQDGWANPRMPSASFTRGAIGVRRDIAQSSLDQSALTRPPYDISPAALASAVGRCSRVVNHGPIRAVVSWMLRNWVTPLYSGRD